MIPERVELPFTVLQQAYLALEAASTIPVTGVQRPEDARAIVRAECAAVVLKAHVQRAINAMQEEV